MKKKISILGTILCLLLTGCGEDIVNDEYDNEISKIGPYIEISHTMGEDYAERPYYFYIAYREDSKIVYEITIYANGNGGGVNIQELHSYDEEGHPILQFYEDGDIVTKTTKHYRIENE